MSEPSDIKKARELQDTLSNIHALMRRCGPDSFLHGHLGRERDQVKAELMEIVKRADAANDTELLESIGVIEPGVA